MPLVAGQLLNNRYRIVKSMGQGGFGAVYRAWDTSLNGPCAVKENFDASPAAQKQFAREASLLFNLRHPGLPRVFDHFAIPDQGQYLVMDFIEGEDLQTLAERAPSQLPVEQVYRWIDQVCEALIYLHTRTPAIIHRDIKPSNIRLTPQGQAVLVDFGIAKQYETGLRTSTGAQAVTPGFSPPEQYGAGNTDAQSDVYALAATAYYLFTRQAPPASVDFLAGNAQAPQRANLLNPLVPAAIAAALEHAMQPNRSLRTTGVQEFRADLLTSQKPVQPGAAALEATLVTAPPAAGLQPSLASVLPVSTPAGQALAPGSPHSTAAPATSSASHPAGSPSTPAAMPPAASAGSKLGFENRRFSLGLLLLAGLCLGLLLLGGGGYAFYNGLLAPTSLPATGPPPTTPAPALLVPPASSTPGLPAATPGSPTALPPGQDAAPLSRLTGSFSLWHSAPPGSPEEAVLLKLIAIAIDTNPGLTLDYVYYPYEEMGMRLDQATQAGNSPDLVYYDNDNLGAWAEQKLISPLEPFSPPDLQAFFPNAVDGMHAYGSLYGLPTTSSTLALFYDKTQVPNPPASSAELLKLALDGLPLVQVQGSYHLFGWSGAYGGRLLDENGKCIADQGDGWTQALYFLLDLQKAGGIFESDYAAAEELFISGKAPMLIDGAWALEGYRQSFGDRLGVALIPGGPAGPAGPLVAHYGFYLTSGSKQPAGAVELASFFTNQLAVQLFSEVGQPPARLDVIPPDPLLAAFTEAGASGFPRPKELYFDMYWNPFQEMFDQVLAGQAPPEKALSEACAMMNAANGK